MKSSFVICNLHGICNVDVCPHHIAHTEGINDSWKTCRLYECEKLGEFCKCVKVVKDDK